MQRRVEVMQYRVEAMQCRVEAMQCRIEAMQWPVKSVQCRIEVMQCCVKHVLLCFEKVRCHLSFLQCFARRMRCHGGFVSCFVEGVKYLVELMQEGRRRMSPLSRGNQTLRKQCPVCLRLCHPLSALCQVMESCCRSLVRETGKGFLTIALNLGFECIDGLNFTGPRGRIASLFSTVPVLVR